MTSTPARGTRVGRDGAPDQTVGGYRLLTRIGEGGMGVVHLARRGEGPRVALKVLRPHVVGDDESRRRLAREVSSLSRVRSRWVAEIVDADPWGPVPYVATRYVPGLSLHEHVHEEGPVTGADLDWFATCLAEGLASVHAVGVLHRDVKPSNVLMEGRTPILIDFGLARVADDPRLTHTGWLLGTPGYLAPEILYGDEPTPAADVHSWAATVAFAATGRPPFGRGPSMAIMDRVRRGEHDLAGMPDPLRRLLAEALDPEPLRRPGLDAVVDRMRAPSSEPWPVPDPGLMTMPYAVEVVIPGVPATVVRGTAPGTARLVDDMTLVTPLPPAVPRASLPERVRRGTLTAVLGLVVGGLVAVWPWWGLGTVVLAVWVLRSGSLAASAVGERRRTRGRRWYDGPQVLVRSPWDLLRSLPSTVALLLWSAGIATAGALVCYGLAAGEVATLFVAGTAFGAAAWSGPGSARVRSPLARVVRPLARSGRRWLVVTFVLVLLATSLGALAEKHGPWWSPGHGRPFTGS